MVMFQEDREQSRIDREQSRIDLEQSRIDLEKLRELSEQSRIDLEKFRELREQSRIDLEKFRETGRMHDEDHKKVMEKHEKALKQLEKTERIVKQNSKQMGGLHRSFGEMAEHLVAPGIEKRFNEMGYHFSETAPKGLKIKDVNGRILTEIDILLENGEYVIVVEVKARPEIADIDHHIKRLEILRESRKKINDKRKILGAIAGAIYEDDVKEAVRDAGFFVIEQSGDTMRLDMPEGWKPKFF
jgi:hypothetical protein